MRRKIFIFYKFDEIEKTQLFINFIRKYQKNYNAIFWIDDLNKKWLKRNIINLVNRLS